MDRRKERSNDHHKAIAFERMCPIFRGSNSTTETRRFAASGPEVSMTSVDVVLKAFERADEVRGDQPYISVHFMGSEHYAR